MAQSYLGLLLPELMFLLQGKGMISTSWCFQSMKKTWLPKYEKEEAALQLGCCPHPSPLEAFVEPPKEEEGGGSQMMKLPKHNTDEEAVLTAATAAVLLLLLSLPPWLGHLAALHSGLVSRAECPHLLCHCFQVSLGSDLQHDWAVIAWKTKAVMRLKAQWCYNFLTMVGINHGFALRLNPTILKVQLNAVRHVEKALLSRYLSLLSPCNIISIFPLKYVYATLLSLQGPQKQMTAYTLSFISSSHTSVGDWMRSKISTENAVSGQVRVGKRQSFLLHCNPRHIYLEVKPITFYWTCFQGSMCRIAATVLEIVSWLSFKYFRNSIKVTFSKSLTSTELTWIVHYF